MTDNNTEYLINKPVPCMDEVFAGRIGQSVDGYRETCCMLTACELGLFDLFSEEHSADDARERIGYRSALMEPFLDILEGMGLLTRNGDLYRNSSISDMYFTSTSPYAQTNHMKLMKRMLLEWNSMTDFLTGNWPERKGEQNSETFIRGISENARSGEIQDTLANVRRYIDLTQHRTLLDIGGGHGMYAIAFKTAYPNLECTLFDQPRITPIARENSELFGVPISIQSGDYYKDKVDGTYDIVFASYNGAGMDPALAGTVADLVNDGGYLIIRHSRPGLGSPFRFIEWNNHPEAEKRDPHAFEKYLEISESHGMKLVGRDIIPVRTEMVILRR